VVWRDGALFSGLASRRKPAGCFGDCAWGGDHSARYQRFVTPLVAGDFACYAYDMRGYGRSGGRRGHINAWSEYREDLRIFLNLVRSHLPGTPVFLFGFSLGSMVALDFVLRDPQGLQGVILSGTPIEPAGVASPTKILLARVMSRIAPTFTIELVAAYDSVTRDPAIIEGLRGSAASQQGDCPLGNRKHGNCRVGAQPGG
jgi:alpha-beta hydrolase superfamily lysophospholipase